MRSLRLFLFFGAYLLSICELGITQPCIPSALNGTTINMGCSQPCTNLNLQTPHLRTSADYVLRDIPYTPYAYTDPSGVEDPAIYADDRYGFLANIPFPFCFFDSTFSTCVVGSNGIITFDAANASCNNAYPISFPAPYAGGSICTIAPAYYARSSIMAGYSDLDPRLAQCPPDRKISWFTVGTAPYRKFIISYYHIGVFLSSCGVSTPNTFQIVLNETTGIVEIFFEQKACQSTTNSGLAILGIQNWARNKAVTYPGRNPGVWTENNTGYQFIPSGAGSRYVSSQLFTLGGTFIANADTATTQQGLLDLNFPNFCPPPGNGQYVLRTTFSNCAAGGQPIVYCDTINIARINTVTANATTTDVLCNATSTGTITVSTPTPGNPPFRYSLDGITWQTSNVFPNLPAGSYTIYFEEGGGCRGTTTATIAEPTVLASTFSTTPVVCNGQSNGIINVTASGGVGPYEYSLDGGTYQSSGTFNTANAGNHTVTIRDANGCLRSVPIPVTEPNVLSLTGNTSTASCDGGNDGLIVVNAVGGNSNFQYSLDGTTFQSSDSFRVAPGNYIVTVRDNLNCVDTQSFIVRLNSNMTHTPLTDETICEGSSAYINFASNATNYTWSPNVAVNNTGIYNPVMSPTATQQYIVSYTLGRCTEEDTMIVNVNAAPVPNAGPDGFICYGQTYQLQGSGGNVYSWTPTTYLNTASAPDPIVKPDNTMTYTLSILADANNCPSLVTDQVTIDVTPPIKVRTYPQDTIVHAGDQFQLLATSVAPNYNWSPGYDLDRTDIPNPVITVDKDVILVVTASSQAGCIGEGSIRIQVYKGPDLYPPTGFTPNGDGLNDKFYPFPVGIQELKYFKVFNRWGQMVFSTNKLWDGWDGKLGGREQGSGTYAWIAQGVTRDGRLITKKGTVVLIR
jgi:gliding motility-associated-like protein